MGGGVTLPYTGYGARGTFKKKKARLENYDIGTAKFGLPEYKMPDNRYTRVLVREKFLHAVGITSSPGKTRSFRSVIMFTVMRSIYIYIIITLSLCRGFHVVSFYFIRLNFSLH